MLATGCMDKSVRFWDVRDGRCVHAITADFEDAVSGVHFVGPNGAPNQVLTSCLDGHLRMHDLNL